MKLISAAALVLAMTAPAISAPALLPTASSESVSHSGGLNRSGCHNETRTGGYHCH
ncbi:YHYH domain-containing protein [Jannaschia sp. J12C1-MA-4]|uniref:YHYH domain-containing protein n=1 Tax=Gymnodinialimonas ceratoperidinii TaxID=2856823 RepID=A0A8F6TYF1_9RHOB|nr:YHYH domain-containing protein [Gymnodinialimonas ceratoperidinii]